MGDSTQASLLLKKQLRELTKKPIEGFSAGLADESNIFEWDVMIMGPEGTLYEGGFFKARLSFPPTYPHMPPEMKFISEMWHPNVYPDGKVCISILHPPGEDKYGYEKASERWLPVHTVETIILSVISMLSDPNDESPANVDAAREWRNEPPVFKKKVQRTVRKTLEDIAAMQLIKQPHSNHNIIDLAAYNTEYLFYVESLECCKTVATVPDTSLVTHKRPLESEENESCHKRAKIQSETEEIISVEQTRSESSSSPRQESVDGTIDWNQEFVHQFKMQEQLFGLLCRFSGGSQFFFYSNFKYQFDQVWKGAMDLFKRKSIAKRLWQESSGLSRLNGQNVMDFLNRLLNAHGNGPLTEAFIVEKGLLMMYYGRYKDAKVMFMQETDLHPHIDSALLLGYTGIACLLSWIEEIYQSHFDPSAESDLTEFTDYSSFRECLMYFEKSFKIEYYDLFVYFFVVACVKTHRFQHALDALEKYLEQHSQNPRAQRQLNDCIVDSRFMVHFLVFYHEGLEDIEKECLVAPEETPLVLPIDQELASMPLPRWIQLGICLLKQDPKGSDDILYLIIKYFDKRASFKNACFIIHLLLNRMEHVASFPCHEWLKETCILPREKGEPFSLRWIWTMLLHQFKKYAETHKTQLCTLFTPRYPYLYQLHYCGFPTGPQFDSMTESCLDIISVKVALMKCLVSLGLNPDEAFPEQWMKQAIKWLCLRENKLEKMNSLVDRVLDSVHSLVTHDSI